VRNVAQLGRAVTSFNKTLSPSKAFINLISERMPDRITLKPKTYLVQLQSTFSKPTRKIPKDRKSFCEASSAQRRKIWKRLAKLVAPFQFITGRMPEMTTFRKCSRHFHKLVALFQIFGCR
jgi:hypothetical protein